MASIKQRLPYKGRGRIHNNKGFWVIQVSELYFVTGQSIKVDHRNSSDVVEFFVKMAKRFTNKYSQRTRYIEEPRSDGAGLHISLIPNNNCIYNEGHYVSFKIDNSELSEYGDGYGGGYITLKVRKQFPFTNDDSGLKANDPGFQPHITIGRIR